MWDTALSEQQQELLEAAYPKYSKLDNTKRDIQWAYRCELAYLEKLLALMIQFSWTKFEICANKKVKIHVEAGGVLVLFDSLYRLSAALGIRSYQRSIIIYGHSDYPFDSAHICLDILQHLDLPNLPSNLKDFYKESLTQASIKRNIKFVKDTLEHLYGGPLSSLELIIKSSSSY